MSISRREMLKVGLGGLSVVSLSGTIPAFLGKFAYADSSSTQPVESDNILVVVQLSGGNDGLNCVVPVGNDAYLKARPVIGLKDRLHKLNDSLALNPGMTAFKEMFDAGQLAIVNGCGYPQPNRSHFRSMEIWQTGAPEGHEGSGWLGHYIDHCCRGSNPLAAVNIGSQLPRALVADSAPVPSINSLEEFAVKVDGTAAQPDQKAEQALIRQLNFVRDASPALQFLARQSTNAIVSSEEIRKLATSGYKPDAIYAPGLGFQLRLIAQIIAGNFGTKLFYTEVGGFDTHSNQVNQHEQLLGRVSAAIASFHKDLSAKGLNKKVTVMCFSEFGRRVTQNDSNGTDHGAPGPMFITGGSVKGGLYGAYPSLSELEDSDLKYTTDYRRVYATLLDKWLSADSATVLRNKFETLDFV